MEAIIGLVIGLFFVYNVLIFSNMIGNQRSNAIKLKYKEFINYYYLTPEKWNLEYMRYDYQCFKFNFIDYQRFWFFKRAIEKEDKNKSQNATTITFIQNIQNDIDEISKDANKKIRYAEDIMKNIKLK